jgi:aquaporin Z
MPGASGASIAFGAELAISFGKMATALVCSNTTRLAPYTGMCCGALVALYITFEAPLSGMSINPARSIASAAIPGTWRDIWIYLAAPPLGMLLAAETFQRARGALRVHCAKLQHSDRYRCIFCGFEPHGEGAE